jgi:hypothetical protein
MIYITGDIHSDPSRFSVDCFPEQKEMTKEDYVVILGDFGLVWDYKGKNNREKYWLDWLENKPFTTLFIDGNHENYDRLDSYPVEEWHGGKIHKIRPSVIHLMRGQVFTIEDKTFFTFGGASSHDISAGILETDDPDFKEKKKRLDKDPFALYRINHVSWWKRELPSEEEMNEGLENLEKQNNKVDYILTHCAYTSLLRQLDGGSGLYESDYLTNYLQKIKQSVDYKQWVFGHFHVNENFYWERATCIYEQIVRIL